MNWLTWLRLIFVSGVVSAATAFAVFKVFGDYRLRETLAKLKAISDKETEQLKAELTKEVEQFRARLDLSPSVVGSKAANGGRVKTGQRM